MSHLSVKINNHYLTMPEDFSVDFEDVNPLWNDYESFAADIELPVEPNRAVLTDVDTVQSDTRLSSIDGQPMQLIIDGIPFRSGKAQTQEGESITDTVMLSMSQTSETLDDIVANLNCREVPVKDKIKIGEAIDSIRIDLFYEGTLFLGFTHGYSNITHFVNLKIKLYNDNLEDGDFIAVLHDSSQIDLPAIAFSTPKTIDDNGNIIESHINTTLDYTGKPYCNARVCYSHHKKGGDTLETEGMYDPFFVLEADRPLSGICFYLLYFLDCLFNYLGFDYDNKVLSRVGDMNKLCFFTTHCKYDKEESRLIYGIDKIKDWLQKRNINYKGYISAHQVRADRIEGDIRLDAWELSGHVVLKTGDVLSNGNKIKSIQVHPVVADSNYLATVVNMYANSDNFPDISVKSVIDSLWAGWGIKFVTDYENKKVKPVFIRDVFRDESEPIIMDVEVLSISRINEDVRGVRVRYSKENDPKEQSQNIKNKKRDYDTDFDYIDYRNVSINKDYLGILKARSFSDYTCYITPNTGNAYRIKVNGDAKSSGELRPTAFEVGGYKGVEIGDCSNDDYIEELTIDLIPALMTDVNGKNERKMTDEDKNTDKMKQYLAVFVDEDMLNENDEVLLSYPLDGYIGATYNVYINTDERYDPADSDDGSSPLQHHDWGAAINIMRGGGAEMQIQKYDYNYDGCGNYKWRTTAGDYTMNPDSIDNWGNDYDYNGTNIEGIGDDERFSLKIQAYKEVNGQILCNADEVDKDGNITRKVRSRGLKDTFMSEYIHWVMNRKLVEIKFRCEAAQLVGIQWDKRYRIGEYVFFWNKLNYTATAKDGIGVVTAQVYI